MTVIGLDPGTEKSAIVVVVDGMPEQPMTVLNDALLTFLECWPVDAHTTLVIEEVVGMGMAVGREVFQTVFWSGRFAQAWRGKWDRVSRRDVKLHLCGTMKAKDQNIRQALIDHFGPGKEKAIGSKAFKGPLYGVKGHEYAALAVALTWLDRQNGEVSRAWASR